MTNRKNWLGILVITLVLGMMVIGCDNGTTSGGGGGGGSTDPALNGTWVQATVYQYSITGNTLTLTPTTILSDYISIIITLTKTSDDGGTDTLNGTWTGTMTMDETILIDSVTYTFNNGSFVMSYEIETKTTSTGTYTTSGNTLWLVSQTTTIAETYQYSISGTTLTLDWMDLTKTSGGGGTDPLNGTWTRTYIYDYDDYYSKEKDTYTFNNGSFVITRDRESDKETYTETETGTYTTSGSNITMTTTTDSSYTYTFNNGILVISYGGTCTYTTSGNIITLRYFGYEIGQYQYSISDNILTLFTSYTDPDTGETLVYKQYFIKK